MSFLPPFNILDFGAVVGGPDNATSLNSCITSLHSSPVRDVQFPVGEYWFTTQPANLSNARFNGQSASTTLLTCDYAGKFLIWDGAQGQGGGIKDLCLYSRTPSSNPAWRALSFESQPTSQSGYFEVEDVVITGAGVGAWLYGIVIDGTLTGTFGMRDINFRNVTITDCSSAGVVIYNGVGIRFTDGYIQGNVSISGTSSAINMNIKIDGTITVAPTCTNVVINGVHYA